MFGFLKKKLKDAVDNFSKKVDEESEEIVEKVEKEVPAEEKGPKKKPEAQPKAKEALEEKEEQKAKKAAPEKAPAEKVIEGSAEDRPEKEKAKEKISEKESEEEKSVDKAEEISEKAIEEEKIVDKAEDKAEEEKDKEEEPAKEKKKGLFESLREKFSKSKIPDEKIAEKIEKLEDIDEKKEEELEEQLAEEIEEDKEKPAEEIEEDKERPAEEIEEDKEKPAEEIEEDKERPAEEIEEDKERPAEKKEDAAAKIEYEPESKDELKAEEKPGPEDDSRPEEKPSSGMVAEEVKKPEQAAKEEEEGPAKKEGLFGRFKKQVIEVVTKSSISAEKFEELFWDIEIALLENNVAVEVIGKIKDDLKAELVDKPIRRGNTVQLILDTLKRSIEELLDFESIDILEEVKKKRPYVIVFVGVNGSGKTTTIGKLAHKLKKEGVSCVMAAADTFRAAAIQQLEEHANNVGVKMIKHDYGADPAAVAFDAIKYANSKKIDCVLIDTAGRLHSNTNLVDEMKKIVRVSKPDLKIFVGESITGNDCIEQAQKFDEAVGLDGIILTKADVDDKGGAALSVSYVTGKPILYMGMGQGYDDLKKFDAKVVMDTLGL